MHNEASPSNIQERIFNLLKFNTLLFVIGFFLFPTPHILLVWYYTVVVIPFLFIANTINFKELSINKTLYITLIFISYYTISSFWSGLPLAGIFDKLTDVALVLSFILVITIIQQKSQRFLEESILWICFSACISSLISVANWIYQHPIDARLTGTFASHGSIMSIWAYGIPALLLIDRICSAKKIKDCFIFTIMLAPILVYITLAQSRGPSIALIVAIAIIFIRHRNMNSLIVLFTLLTASISTLTLYQPIMNHIKLGIPYRPIIWKTIFHRAMHSPIFGNGFGSYHKVVIDGITFHHPHSIYLTSFLYGGVVGLILFALVGFGCALKAWENRENPLAFKALIILIFGAICFVSDSSFILGRPQEYWLCFWLPVAIIINLRPSAHNLTNKLF